MSLKAFPNATRARAKTSLQGGGGPHRRWKDSKGTIYERDSLHGAVERHNKRGKHLGAFDPETGEQTEPANSGRVVEP